MIHNNPRMLHVPQKKIRAQIIARHMRQAGYASAVVFTCGNAATALRKEALHVLEIGPQGSLDTRRWWTPAEIRATWPYHFDATPGHLSMLMMWEIAQQLKENLGLLDASAYGIPTGSGETILCLKMAYPHKKFFAVYDDSKPATQRDKFNPLNGLVSALFDTYTTQYENGGIFILKKDGD